MNAKQSEQPCFSNLGTQVESVGEFYEHCACLFMDYNFSGCRILI